VCCCHTSCCHVHINHVDGVHLQACKCGPAALHACTKLSDTDWPDLSVTAAHAATDTCHPQSDTNTAPRAHPCTRCQSLIIAAYYIVHTTSKHAYADLHAPSSLIAAHPPIHTCHLQTVFCCPSIVYPCTSQPRRQTMSSSRMCTPQCIIGRMARVNHMACAGQITRSN
jgi:hypothetical protein